MESLNVVLYQSNAEVSQTLAAHLSRHFRSVHVACECQEIRPALARYRADVLVLDLETSCFDDVQTLRHEFPNLSIVCTHRLADEELWAEALRQGASDMCDPGRTEDIVRSVMRERAHHAAA